MQAIPQAQKRPDQITVAIRWALWLRGYHLAIATSMVFFLCSFLMWTIEEASLPPNLFGPLVFAIGSFSSFVIMVRSGGSLAAVAWFILGSGVYFGAGSALWGLVPEIHPLLLVSQQNLALDIGRINMLNSASVLLVLLSAYPICTSRSLNSKANTILHVDWYRYYRLVLPLAGLAIFLQFLYFPNPQDLVVRGLLTNLDVFVPVFFLLTGLLWTRLPIFDRILALPLLTVDVMLGALTFSKMAFMLPILSLIGGIWISQNSIRKIVAPSAILCVAYFLLVAPTIGRSRSHSGYDPANNTLNQRAQILSSAMRETTPEDEDKMGLLRRFAHGPIQVYLVDEYLSGRPGETLADFWAALVPRILWPEKPIITRFGGELDSLYKNRANSTSALAPTFSAEAYWNYGGWGCFVVSILLGLELGWLTRRWFHTMAGRDDAFLLIAFPSAIIGFSVSTWIAASYVGGFITLVLLWIGFRFLLRNSSLRAMPSKGGQ